MNDTINAILADDDLDSNAKLILIALATRPRETVTHDELQRLTGLKPTTIRRTCRWIEDSEGWIDWHSGGLGKWGWYFDPALLNIGTAGVKGIE